jgi:transposase-like protein
VGSKAGKKVTVMTLVDRETGEARTFKVPNAKKQTLQAIARPVVDGSAHIITDQHMGYSGIDKPFASHHTVDHSKQFVRSIIFHELCRELPLAPKARHHRHVPPYQRGTPAPVSARV